MEKSWKLTNRSTIIIYKPARLCGDLSKSKRVLFRSWNFFHLVMEKSWNFVVEISWQPWVRTHAKAGSKMTKWMAIIQFYSIYCEWYFSDDLSSPEGLAIDWLSRNMYWTDSGMDRIEVSKLDGKQRKVLFDTDLVNPRAIVVDAANGWMIFSFSQVGFLKIIIIIIWSSLTCINIITFRVSGPGYRSWSVHGSVCLLALLQLNHLMYGHKIWYSNWPWWSLGHFQWSRSKIKVAR